LMMIRLAAACRNTSVKRTTGTAPEPMMRLIPLTQVRPYVVGAVLGVGRRLFGDCFG